MLLQGGGGWGATNWRAKSMSSLKTAKCHPLVLFAPPHITKVVKSMAKLTSQSCGDLYVTGWLLVQWRWSHLKITPALIKV